MASRSMRWLMFASVAALPLLLVVVPILSFLVLSVFHVENNRAAKAIQKTWPALPIFCHRTTAVMSLARF